MPRTLSPARFLFIFLSICVALFLSALELTAVSTALPTIAHTFHADDYSWVGSAYTLSSTAFLPMSGGIAQIFGRRPALLLFLAMFALGSGLCGGANSMSMLIAGRAVQGIGGGGIRTLSSIILADMVSLQKRGLFSSFFGLTWSVACLSGPVVGGTLAAHGQWRLLFYINLPICAAAAVFIAAFLDLPTPPGTFHEKLMRLDWTGNAIVFAGMTALTIALTWGGITAPWTSAQVLAPLVLGVVLLFIFILWEARYAAHPLVPLSLLSNRTSLSGYLQTFCVGFISLGIVYYMPVFYQGCKDASPIRSGVYILGFSSLALAALIVGVVVNRTQRYRPQMWTGWCFILIGLGLHTSLTMDTNVGRAVGFGVIVGIGIGFEYSTTVFPILAPLPVAQNAAALALLQFLRSFAGIWGITIGAAVLQNELAHRIPAEFLESRPQGAAIAYALIPQVSTMAQPLKREVQDAFASSLRVLWQILLGMGGIGFLSSLLMKGLPLPAKLDKNWSPPAAKNGGLLADADSKETEKRPDSVVLDIRWLPESPESLNSEIQVQHAI